ncbi:hypothetical protein B4U79_18479, partial [Dinothrombium tinctorium]
KRWLLRYKDTGLLNRNAGSGRNRVTKAAEDKEIVAYCKANPFSTAVEIKNALALDVDKKTIIRRLREMKIRSRVAAHKPKLQIRHEVARLDFALLHKNWANEWSSVIFTDEKSVQSSRSGPIRVFRPENSRYDPEYVIYDANRGFTVNFHGWISIDGRGDLQQVSTHFNSIEYLDLISEKVLPSIRQRSGGNFIFMHDNAPIHTAKRVKAYLEQNEINVLKWPALSPDLNPIENVWGLFAKKIKRYIRVSGPIKTKEEMVRVAQESWSQITPQFIRKLYSSMPRRMKMVCDREGGPIVPLGISRKLNISGTHFCDYMIAGLHTACKALH